MTKISKSIAFVLGLSLALTLVAGVSANAQSMSLSDLIDALVKAGVISSDKAVAAKAVASASTSASFTKDLTVGSKGDEVSALQKKLGVSVTGYFGALTKAAVVAFQKENGLPSTGYVGALTRAKLNAGSTVAATTTGSVTTGSTVVNSGVEGTLTADRFSVSNTTAYEGDSNVPVIAVKLTAKLSDINVQRIKLNLGASTSIYTKVYKALSVVDDSGKVIARADLNSNTVVKDGSNYYLTLGGFSYTVAKDSSKVLTVKADVYSSIKTADQGSKTITIDADGVRGTDGAGIDQYAPSNSFSQSVTISTTLADSATLNLSTNSANYKTTDVVAADGSNEDELDKLAVLAFDLKANKADLNVTDLTVHIAPSGSGTATATTAYLYDGSTLIATESVGADGDANFTDSNQLFSVAKDATRTLTVKIDVRSASADARSLTATVAASSISAENSAGESKTTSGSATGEAMVIRNTGPIFTLVSKNIAVSGTNNSGSTLSTSTITATFAVRVTAKGGDITFGSQASTTAPAFDFATYDAAGSSYTSGVSSTTGFAIPTSGVVTTGLSTTGFTVQENNTVDLNNITVTIPGKSSVNGLPLNSIAVGINTIRWYNAAGTLQTSTFMSGKTDWRTTTQTP